MTCRKAACRILIFALSAVAHRAAAARTLQLPPNADAEVVETPVAPSSSSCPLCTVPGSTLRADAVPVRTAAHARAASDGALPDAAATMSNAEATTNTTTKNTTTCREWQDWADSSASSSAGGISARHCLDLRDWLQGQCCSGMPPRYECESRAEEAMLGGGGGGDGSDGAVDGNSWHYMADRIPLTDGPTLDITVTMEVMDVSISNYGVDGGTIEVDGALHLSWEDARLTWDPSGMGGCVSVKMDPAKIWTPALADVGDYDEEPPFALSDARATVMADGRVTWIRRGKIRLECDEGRGRRVCSVDLMDGMDGADVRFVSTALIVGDDAHTLSEYRLVRDESSLIKGGSEEAVRVQFVFDPLRSDCNLCGHAGAKLKEGEIRNYPTGWLGVFPESEGSSCGEIDTLLRTVPVEDEECYYGRAFYSPFCCDDMVSAFSCETDIHDRIVDMTNLVTPPEPYVRENDSNFQSKESVRVEVSLDVHHVMGIDVKTNSMKLMVSLDLKWYDQRLEWSPFIGGCHRASYLASPDFELTEIWTPDIELVNMIDGVQSFPEARASVRSDGKVDWRRTGVLVAYCSLTGIVHFPFDETECFLEFGGTRDPLYHRVEYVPKSASIDQLVEYGSIVSDESWNYQEYKIATDKTKMDIRTEIMSGFENEIIRFEFTLQRASGYYVTMFVVLYIIFTFLSFGMFFIDYTIGERIGYGSSILFVIVAQDITLLDSTPVTQEFLWIYKLSFGSKIFVVSGIVESIFMVYLHRKITEKDVSTVSESVGQEQESLLDPQANGSSKVSESGKQEQESLLDPQANGSLSVEPPGDVECASDNLCDGESNDAGSLNADSTSGDGSEMETPQHSFLTRIRPKRIFCVSMLRLLASGVKHRSSDELVIQSNVVLLRRLDYEFAVFIITVYCIFLVAITLVI